jgi:hypothetical protein
LARIINKYQLNKNELPLSANVSLNHDINIEWLIKKVTKEAKYELTHKPKETIKVIASSFKAYHQMIELILSFFLFLH